VGSRVGLEVNTVSYFEKTSFVEGMAKSESAGAAPGAKEIVASKTMFEIKKRVNTFDLLLA